MFYRRVAYAPAGLAADPRYGWYNARPASAPGYTWTPPMPGPPKGLPLPAPPQPPCPPGYVWCPPEHQKGGNALYGFFDYYWPGGCCPIDPNYMNCAPGPQLDGKCVPPINVPPKYNPCQPGWSYYAPAKKCCPPGWKYDPYLEQCVPI